MINTYIETILSLVVMYALLSVLVSLLNELYRQAIRDRGRLMFSFVQKMLSDGKNLDLAYLTFRHPLIDHMRSDDKTRPSYIQDKVFATAFIQTVGDLSTQIKYITNEDNEYIMQELREANPVLRFQKAVSAMHPTPLKSTLLGMVERAMLNKEDAYSVLEREIMDWFNNQMNALSRMYKTRQRKSLLICSAVVTMFLNIDSLHLVHELRNDPVVRTELAGKSEIILSQYERVIENLRAKENDLFDTLDDRSITSIIQDLKRTNQEISEAELPIGWGINAAPLSWFSRGDKIYESSYDYRRNKPSFLGVVFYFFGLLISVFSLSMGAPFWFDFLNRLVSFRKK